MSENKEFSFSEKYKLLLSLEGRKPEIINMHSVFIILSMANLINLSCQKELGKYDMQENRLVILLKLYKEKKSLQVSDFSKLLDISSATATSLCKRLERDGLITKVRSESDNRQVYTTLTKEGISFVESIAFSHKDWIVNLLDGVNKDELSQFFTLAKKISVELNSNIENISKKE